MATRSFSLLPAVATSPMDIETLTETLRPLVAQLGITLDDQRLKGLAAYALELWKWNEKLNLTRHTTPEQFVNRDVLDSWELCKLVNEGEEILDFGTGSGVPGLVMKILRPDLQMTVVDSVAKKGKALIQIAKALKMDVMVCIGRGEEVLEEDRFDAVVTRAVGPLPELLTMLQDHWLSVGRLLCVKGPKWVDERSIARAKGLLNELELRKVLEYPMPGTESSSVILKIWPKGVPERLP